MNKIIKLIIISVMILFLSLYFSRYSTNYYEDKKEITNEAIKRYEEDLKQGIKINPSNYQEEEKNYDNKISKIGIKTSKLIEKSFEKGLKFVMKKLTQLESN